MRPRYHAHIGERVYVLAPPQAMIPEGLASLPPHLLLVSVRRVPERHRFEVYPIRCSIGCRACASLCENLIPRWGWTCKPSSPKDQPGD